MNSADPKQPPTVPEGAKQGGETQAHWDWVERTVWTDRMLATLKEGPKGGKWYSLFDKVWKPENLRSAAQAVIQNKGGAGIDGMTTIQLAERIDTVVAQTQERLQTGSYRPKAVKREWIAKLGSTELRPLGVPVVVDRTVQKALQNVLEPIFEHGFATSSYGFRPKRGARQALGQVADLLSAQWVWVVDADIKGYFDNIPQDKLLKAVATKVSDGAVMELIEQFLKQGVMESGKGWKPTEQGTPQGAVISPLLANIYLDPLDHLMEQRGWKMVRYADDFVVLCETREQAERALTEIKAWMEQAGLKLHPTKTRIIDARQPGGFDFLGYHFERGHRWPRQKSQMKLKESIRAKTRRTEGRSMKTIIDDINKTARGWNQYFQFSDPTRLRRINEWIRQRLRAILKQRAKRTGPATGSDYQRWPNAFFRQLGLHEICANPQLRLSIPGTDF